MGVTCRAFLLDIRDAEHLARPSLLVDVVLDVFKQLIDACKLKLSPVLLVDVLVDGVILSELIAFEVVHKFVVLLGGDGSSSKDVDEVGQLDVLLLVYLLQLVEVLLCLLLFHQLLQQIQMHQPQGLMLDFILCQLKCNFYSSTMGSQLCNPNSSVDLQTIMVNQNHLPKIESIRVQRKPSQLQNEAKELIDEKSIEQKELYEGKELLEPSSFPLVNKHVEERIRKVTRVANTSNKVWRIKHNNNIVFANTDQTNSQSLPKGYVQLYKLKENGDFQGYFEGNLDQSYQPVLDQQSIFVFPNASYFIGTGIKKGNYINEVTGLSYSGGWLNQQPQGFGEQKNNKGTYVGQYHLGYKQGKGKFKWNDDDNLAFDGHFIKGLFNGKGVIQDSKNKYYYEGQFKNGQKNGYGIQKQQLQIYEGFFHKGQRCGKGKLKILNPQDKTIETIFQGNFYQGIPNGRGSVSKPNKQLVEGIWEDGHVIAVQ